MNWALTGNPTFTALIAIGIANHTVLTGSRVTVTLDALRFGASTATVGVLLALYAIVPTLCAVAAGRLSDRIGVRRPMLVGSIFIGTGAALPALFPGLTTLFIGAPVVGTGFMLFQVAVQNATGEMGGPMSRAHNFSVLALGYSISGLLGPLIAGYTIDHAGFTATFAVLAVIPLIPIAVLARGMRALPGPHPAHRSANAGNVMELLTHKQLRPVFLVNVLLAIGWDVHTIVIPIYGAKIALTASQIGLILASFAAATFIVRLAMRWIIRRFTEREVLTIALFSAGLVYLLFPFSHTAGTLMVLSFCLGLGLGMSQPMVLSLLHSHAPPGRMGETVGVRVSLVNSMSVAVPLAFGAVGATVGLTPVFWSVGLCLATGGWLTKRAA